MRFRSTHQNLNDSNLSQGQDQPRMWMNIGNIMNDPNQKLKGVNVNGT